MKTQKRFARPIHSLACWFGIQVVLALLLPKAGSCQTYAITDLSSNIWLYSEAHGINSNGHVVGEYEPANNVLGFWYANGIASDLGHLSGAPYAGPYGINFNDQVVGESDTAKSTHAFLYSNGIMQDLGTLGGNDINGYSSAHAINSGGNVVGESSVSFNQIGTIHAALYSAGNVIDLGALGGDYSSASAINSSGLIVGESDVVSQGATNVHAFQYRNSAMTDLGTLGGSYSSAKGVNDSGVIVGEAETVIGGTTFVHAFLYRNGTMSDLGTLGGTVSSASAINSAGLVVGYATDTNEVSNAFLYDGLKMINLNDFVAAGSDFTNLSSADAINDAGQITGSGYKSDGTYQAYLLTPITALGVTITNPSPNVVLAAPASFTIGAVATDKNATVTNVEFLLNGSYVGNATAAPYGATVSNVGSGSYLLSAIAADNAGVKATNAIPVTVSATPVLPVTISNPSLSGAGFSFSFSTQAGFAYQAQFASQLGAGSNWTTFTNLAGTGAPASVSDPSAAGSQRFYRVIAH